jgi:hypothetical protein
MQNCITAKNSDFVGNCASFLTAEVGQAACNRVGHQAMSNRFEIVVRGIDDSALVAAVESAIREAFREMSLPGSWRVVVKPSGQPTQAGDRWDFAVYGLDVRHELSMAVPPDLLPNLIPQRLRESLNRPVSRSIEEAAQRTLDLARAV